MSPRRLVVFVILGMLALAARAENPAPRDLWSQATAAALSGDLNTAVQKTNELFSTGRSYGVTTFPAYASSAASMSREQDKAGKKDIATWAAKTAQQLDPHSPAVAFTMADAARDRGDWPGAIRLAITGYGRVFSTYRTRVLARADLMLALSLMLALTTAVFAIALFIRHGHAMAHDFRELLGLRFHGGAVTVLAFALLFLPIFLWFSPLWLVLYWLVIFFGYAEPMERVIITILFLVLAALPLAVDRASTMIAGIDNPIVEAAFLSSTQSYRPEVLHRVEDFGKQIPDNDVVHLLLGNLELQEGNEQQAQIHYQRAADLRDSAGAHVNLGNLHFLNNDFPAAITEYEKAEQVDPKLAIVFYNNSLASGELYRFDEQGQKLEQAKKLDRADIERLTQNQPPQKVVIYTPPLEEVWAVSTRLARHGAGQTLFGAYSYFDPVASAKNPVTLGSIAALVIAFGLWLKRRKFGFANACIKCGRTFCPRCKSARESATYCTQCIHIYLKRDGVSLDTKRRKLEEVQRHQTGMLRRNRILATFLPGSAQVLEGRTLTGVAGIAAFLLFVCVTALIGRLAPAIGPVAETAQLLARAALIVLALITWLVLSLPVYRRKQALV